MIYVFYAVSFFGFMFFCFRRRRFDFVSAAFFGMLIYFMPGFVGLVFNPYFPNHFPIEPISWQAYSVWISAMLGTIITGMLYSPERENNFEELRTSWAFDNALIIILLTSFVFVIIYGGQDIYSPEKDDVLSVQGRWFILFSTITQVCFASFFIQKKYIYFIPAFAAMSFLIFVGFRSYLAISSIAILIYFAHKKGIMSFFRPKYLVTSLLLVFFIFSYKSIYIAVKMGRLDLVSNIILGQDFIYNVLYKSEPFITQSILNEVLLRNYSIDPMSILYSFVAIIPFLSSILGIENSDLSFGFQEQLFPNLDYGLASNIYANFYSTIGIFGIFIFIISYNFILVQMSKRMGGGNSYVRLTIFLLGGFIAFYINRNDLTNSISVINRIIYVIALTYIISKPFEIFGQGFGVRGRR